MTYVNNGSYSRSRYELEISVLFTLAVLLLFGVW